MALPTAQQTADQWSQGMSGATEKIKRGIQNVTESPTQKAANRSDAYLLGVQRAVANGKYRDGLMAVTLEDWKRAALDKGVGRIAGGAVAAKGKFADFMTQFLPHIQSGLQALASMPRGTLEENINRAVSMMRHNATFQRRRS